MFHGSSLLLSCFVRAQHGLSQWAAFKVCIGLLGNTALSNKETKCFLFLVACNMKHARMWSWRRMEKIICINCVKKWRSITQSQWGQEYPTYHNKKANWMGHILPSTYLLNHVTEGKKDGRIEVMEKWGWRSKLLLDNFKEMRGYFKIKELAVDHTVWEPTLEEAIDLS